MGRVWLTFLCLWIGLTSCSAGYVVRRSGPRLADIDGRAPTLKLHLADGSVYILSQWKVAGNSASIRGTGRWFSADRVPESPSPKAYTVPLSSVVFFETNSTEHKRSYFMIGLALTELVLAALLLQHALEEGE